MTISYPVSLPTLPQLKRVKFTQKSAVSFLRSPYTYISQVQAHQGNLWEAEVTLPDMERALAETWMAFLLSLNGPQGTFLLGDPLGKTPRGIASGLPKVNGGSQVGYTLVTDGWSNSITNILMAGDWIQISNRIYKITQNVNSDGSGNATLDIWPRLRGSPADNDTVVTINTTGIFRLNSIENDIYDTDESRIYTISFSAIEAW